MLQAEGQAGGVLILGLSGYAGEPGVFRSPTGEMLRGWVRDIMGSTPVMLDYLVRTPATAQMLFSHGHPTPTLTIAAKQYKERLKVLQPKVVILVGSEVTRALLDYGVSEFNMIFNYVIERDGIKFIPAHGLAELNIPTTIDDDESLYTSEYSFYRNQFWFKAALMKGLKIAQGHKEPDEVYLIKNDPKEIDAYLDLLLKQKLICFDLETAGKKDRRLTSIGMGFDNYCALAVTPDSDRFARCLDVVRTMMADPNVLKINQNIMGFDAPILWKDYGFDLKGRVWDTLHVFNFIYPELPHGLRDQGRLYLYRDPWKGFHGSTGERLRQYNAEDVVATMRCFQAQRDELKAWGQLDHVVKYIVDYERHAWHIMTRGIRFDEEKREAFKKPITEACNLIHSDLVTYAQPFLSAKSVSTDKRDPSKDIPLSLPVPEGLKKRAEVEVFLAKQGILGKDIKEHYLATKADRTKYGLEPGRIYKKAYSTEISLKQIPFNPNSEKQLKNVFDNMGIKLPKSKKSNKTWGPSTNKKALMTMLRNVRKPLTLEQRAFVQGLLRFRETNKFITTYLNAKIDEDGRWRCKFNINGTATGRASSSQTLWGTGGNNQNIPRDGIKHFKDLKFKKCFIPDRDKTLFQFDQATAEMVIVAYLARCDKLISMLNNNEDVHVYFISQALGEDITIYKETDPAKYKRLRQLGKGGNFSGSYGTGPKTLADMFMLGGTDVTVDEAAFILNKRREVFPEIYEIFQQEVIDALHKNRTLETPFGRKRKFFGKLDENLYREAFAFIPQSTVPYISNHMIHLIQTHRPFGAEVLQQGHDAVMGQLNLGQEDAFKKWFMDEAAKLRLTIHGRDFAMKWAGGFGPSWGDLD